MTDTRDKINPTVFFEVTGISLAYLLLYHFNAWFFAVTEFSSYIAWIYLPAAVRILAVLVFGWRGVTGLLIGNLLTSIPMFGAMSLDAYIFPSISAFCPLLAVMAGTYMMKIRADLGGLKAWELIVFSLLGAMFNSIAQNTYFLLSHKAGNWLPGLVPMFVGDVAGTLIVLYMAFALLRLFTSPDKRSAA